MTIGMYEYNVVVDLEMNPTFAGNEYGLKNEIVEIGAVKSDCNGNVIDTFQKCVRPQFSRDIAPQIYKLTGIKNKEILSADTIGIVLVDFLEWIGDLSNVRFVSWSDTDYHQIVEETKAKNISCFFIHRWLDLQKIFPKMYGITNRHIRMKLKDAADYCGIEVVKSHRALEDAIVTNEVLASILNGECVPKTNYINQEIASSTIGDKFGSILSQLLCS